MGTWPGPWHCTCCAPLSLLGMGADGHTASLFPGTDALAERKRWVVANEVPQLETSRMTLTYPLINAARDIVFLVTGEAKAEMLARVIEGPGEIARHRGRCTKATHIRADKAIAVSELWHPPIPHGAAFGIAM